MMNIFEPDIKPRVEALRDTEQRQEYKLVGQVKLKPGMKLFQLQTETLEVTEVTIVKQKAVDFEGKALSNSRASYDPKCIYVTAINEQNAARKFLKIIKQCQRTPTS